jgi:ribose transport system substrate-binding protein
MRNYRIVALAVTLASCAAPTPQSGEISTEDLQKQLAIGWSGPSLIDPYQVDLKRGVFDEAADLGVRVIHYEHGYDAAKQAADIEDLITQRVDFMLIGAGHADAVVSSIEKVNAAGIPVMTFDQGASGGELLGHSGNDNYCMGYRSMEYLVQLLDGKGKVLHITGIPGMQLVQWNVDAVKAVVEQHPGIELVYQGFADWDQAKALAITEDTLAANPDLVGIYVISSAMSGGVLQALRARELIGKVIVVSGSWDEMTQDHMRNGEIRGTIEYRPYEGGRLAVRAAYDYLVNGKIPAKWVPWPLIFHTPDETWEVECPIGDWEP